MNAFISGTRRKKHDLQNLRVSVALVRENEPWNTCLIFGAIRLSPFEYYIFNFLFTKFTSYSPMCWSIINFFSLLNIISCNCSYLYRLCAIVI